MNSSMLSDEEKILEKLKERHIMIRRPEWQSLTRIRAILLESIGKTFREEGFVEVRVPTIASPTGSCENPDTLFKVHYSDDGLEKEYGYLIQTCQLYLEALIYVHQKVYSINQSYRAEHEVDTRHLTEFTLIEVEATNYDLENLMRLQEKLILGMADYVLKKSKEDLDIVNARLGERIEEIKRKRNKNGRYFSEITYDEAIDNLNETENGKELNLNRGEDIPGEGERILMELNDNLPLFVTHYPRRIKYFNMKDSEEFKDRVNSCDLLLPGVGEVCGCAEREADPEKLRKKFRESIMFTRMKHRFGRDVAADFEWLFDLGRYESSAVAHGGFGMGFERVVQWICNADSILECLEFPRNIRHMNP